MSNLVYLKPIAFHQTRLLVSSIILTIAIIINNDNTVIIAFYFSLPLLKTLICLCIEVN